LKLLIASRVHLLSLLCKGGSRQRTIPLSISWRHLMRWWLLWIAGHYLWATGLHVWCFHICC